MSSKIVEKCGVCQFYDAKYKCPKCGIRYCSLACYKDENRHKDPTDIMNQEAAQSKREPIRLSSPEHSKLYSASPEIRELLRYNTVKFHLSKVYRILCSEVAESEGSTMNSELRKQLATDYLNTLRYGGIHYNEAVEEFCQISLSKMNNVEYQNDS